MEFLVKFTQESLAQKNDSQLRKILRSGFAYSKGTSIMNQQQLIDKILELRKEKLDEIDRNSGLDFDLVYKDLVSKEWKIKEIKEGLVYIQNNDDFTTNVTLKSFKQTFTATRYQKFTVKDEFNSTETIDEASQTQASKSDPVVEQTTQKTQSTSTKEKSKSDIVRSIIRKQYKDEDVKMTSGTVMKELKTKHDQEIHRSFCSSLIRKYLDSLKPTSNE